MYYSVHVDCPAFCGSSFFVSLGPALPIIRLKQLMSSHLAQAGRQAGRIVLEKFGF